MAMSMQEMLAGYEQIITAKNAQITDLHALAESNTATIDRLLSEVKALRELADTQAAIIAAKNAEIAEMRGDYADALESDAETTLYQKHFRPAIEQALADDDLTALGILEAAAIAAEYDDDDALAAQAGA